MHPKTLTVLSSLPWVDHSPSACGSRSPFQVRPGASSLPEPCWRCSPLKFYLWPQLLDEPWIYVVVLFPAVLLAPSSDWAHWMHSGPRSPLSFVWDCQRSLLPAPCSAHSLRILCRCVLAGEGTELGSPMASVSSSCVEKCHSLTFKF